MAAAAAATCLPVVTAALVCWTGQLAPATMAAVHTAALSGGEQEALLLEVLLLLGSLQELQQQRRLLLLLQGPSRGQIHLAGPSRLIQLLCTLMVIHTMQRWQQQEWAMCCQQQQQQSNLLHPSSSSSQ